MYTRSGLGYNGGIRRLVGVNRRLAAPVRNRRGFGLGRWGLGVLNYPDIDNAIQKFEGWFAGSRSQQNNNPGNMVYASWMDQFGCSPGGAGGFASCPTVEAGQEILDYRVSQLVDSGGSLSSLLDTWACGSDASGNCTYPGSSTASYQNYVASVAADTGLNPSAPISSQLTPSSDTSGIDLSSVSSLLPDLSDMGDITPWLILGGVGAVALVIALG